MENIINEKELDKLDFKQIENLLNNFDLDSVQYDLIEEYILINFDDLSEPIFDGTRFVGHRASGKWERIDPIKIMKRMCQWRAKNERDEAIKYL